MEVDGNAVQAPVPLIFAKKETRHFFVEYTRNGSDLIYHFFPPGGKKLFCDDFGELLEDGFKAVLPPYADVRAEHIPWQEGTLLMRHDEDAGDAPRPRESYCVRVLGWADRAGADVMLKARVFAEIEKAIDGVA